MRRALIAAALAVIVAAPAAAHDEWADGRPVPPAVRSGCCGKGDAHWLKPDQVHPVKGGYMFDGWPDLIPYDRVEPSPDGEIWGFWSFSPASTGFHGETLPASRNLWCVFMPPPT